MFGLFSGRVLNKKENITHEKLSVSGEGSVGVKGVGVDTSMEVLDLFESVFSQEMTGLKASNPMMAVNDHILLFVYLGEFLGKLGQGDMKGVGNPDTRVLPIFPDIKDNKVVTILDAVLEFGRMKLQILVS